MSGFQVTVSNRLTGRVGMHISERTVGIGEILKAVFLILNALQGNESYSFMGGFKWQNFVYAMWEPFLCIGINMKLIVLYREQFNFTNAFTKIMAKSSFTAYIFHFYFVVFGTMVFTRFSLGAIPEILLMCLPVVVACFLFATFIRSMPLLKRIL